MVRMGTCAADGVWVVVVVEVVDVEVVERRLTFRFGPESNQLENHSVGRKVIYWLGPIKLLIEFVSVTWFFVFLALVRKDSFLNLRSVQAAMPRF